VESRDSSVGIATGYGPDGRGSISGKGEEIFLFHGVHTGSGAHLAYSTMDTRSFFLGVRRSGREAKHSPPSGAFLNHIHSR
jgi:hypothetical protein